MKEEKDSNEGVSKKKGGKFLNLFFEKKIDNKPVPKSQNQTANMQLTFSTSADITINQEFYKQLTDVTVAKGKSYETFLGMLNDLSVISDEKQRYEAALKALTRTSGISVDELIHALDAKVEALKIESEEFGGVLDDKYRAIEGFDGQISEIDKKVSDIDQEKQRLLGEKESIVNSQKELQEKTLKAEQDFGNALERARNEIQAAKEKIINFLGGAK